MDRQAADAVTVRCRARAGSTAFCSLAHTDAGAAKLFDARCAGWGLLCDRLRRRRALALAMALSRAVRAFLPYFGADYFIKLFLT